MKLTIALFLLAGGSLQEPLAPAATEAEPGAQAAWERLLDASRVAAAGQATPPEPITAFRLEAEILTRDGVQTNETKIDYRYLAPDCVRFLLPSRREIGRFGAKQREHWLRDGEEVVPLAGREYESDRRQIREMHAVAKNFVALSDPARLRITAMELLAGSPADVPAQIARTARKLEWLRVTSPDFALLGREGDDPGVAPSFVVDLGLQPAGLPRFAIIREAPRPDGGAVAQPMLIRLGRFEERARFRIPLQLEVFALEPTRRPHVFTDMPAQEIYITTADLRPTFQVDDFRP